MSRNIFKRVSAKKKLLAALAAAFCFGSQPLPVFAAGHEAVQQDMNIKDRINAILRGAAEKNKKSSQQEIWGDAACVMHEMPTSSKDAGGTLLFSDSPEYVTQDGVLYRDTVTGDARVFYYHLNNTDVPKKVVVVLQNKYDGINVIKLTRGGSSAPSQDYLYVGKTTQMNYFAKGMDDTFVLTRNMGRLLQDQMNTTLVKPGELVAGMYDFHAAQPVEVSVLMMAEDADPLAAARDLPVLPKDEMRLRGTFAGMNRELTVKHIYDPETDGVRYFRVADDERDKFRDGIDATDGSKVRNVGNYGIVYRINIPTRGKKPVQYYLSPLGGVYAGAMLAVSDPAGKKLLPVPAKPFFGDKIPAASEPLPFALGEGAEVLAYGTEVADLGVYPSDRPVYFLYSPPGASNLPVNIILKPNP
ncbi:hypothetical protein SAMN02910356_02440 [Selenomonas sp. GACV-9]|uniref:hypothetical protein n=1 Tax=Selenomonas sp. GACV-9 TaxID=3158782 RepID=UPI0008F00150|nr:hypothetical protein SAMN02910356_02440 [Selenomonas ruminantium]